MTECRQQSYETVIGLEVHLQFNTRSKIFCACANRFGQPPNTNTCPICLGLPGTLPVLNKTALDYAIKVALALHCQINSYIKFDRKNYYYPDLPKGYQLSQYDYPIGKNGYVEIFSEDKFKNIRVHRAHMEEDAGKLIHDAHNKISLIDYNRSGTPLMEIVTEPDIRSPQEAYDYLTALKLLLQYLKVSDCDMEKGSLRCDANISVRPVGSTALGVKTEVKNMNSFQNVQDAIDFEIRRQLRLIAQCQAIEQITLLWDAHRGVAEPMRSKEYSHDYRYFPEPDLPPIQISEAWIAEIAREMPEMADEKTRRYVEEYQLPLYDAQVLTEDREIAQFFEQTIRTAQDKKLASNWIMGEVLRALKEKKGSLADLPVTPARLGELLNLISENVLNQTTAKKVFERMLKTGIDAGQIMKEQGLKQISDQTELESLVQAVLAERPKEVIAFHQGNAKVFGFLVGEVMKASSGKANPKMTQETLHRLLQAKQPD